MAYDKNGVNSSFEPGPLQGQPRFGPSATVSHSPLGDETLPAGRNRKQMFHQI